MKANIQGEEVNNTEQNVEKGKRSLADAKEQHLKKNMQEVFKIVQENYIINLVHLFKWD